VALALLGATVGATPASAQKQGSILKMFSPDSPASMSILEEATAFSQRPMMGVFNNLVIYDQQIKQNSLASIIPDLATAWSWSEASRSRCSGMSPARCRRRAANWPRSASTAT
jgi:peptide/nickel transport system substrate-binding protein